MSGTAPQGSAGVTVPRGVQTVSGCGTSWSGLVGVVGSSQRSFPALMIPWFCVLALISAPVYVFSVEGLDVLVQNWRWEHFALFQRQM